MERTTKKIPTYAIFRKDPLLLSYKSDILLRMDRYHAIRRQILAKAGSLVEFANGHLYYGFHKTEHGWVYREWAPAASCLHLIGDFNDWNPSSHPLQKMSGGNWEIFLPGTGSLRHEARVKVRVTSGGQVRDRIPLYIHRVVQDPQSHDFFGQIWDPPQPFEWHDDTQPPERTEPPLIYEAHVGMAQNKESIGSYTEFRDNVLPRVKNAGYNTIQLMGILEHPYYASFGYQVSNFFAASAWFGTPEDLKSLIDEAHRLGIRVLIDLVHSHAVKNTREGINEFDGTAEQFFHSGERGSHKAWGSKLFEYGKIAVMHFLLSNIKYWLTEYHFDGFRFDGVTSMIYQDHGLGAAFDHYNKYFSLNTDFDALVYLQLANELTHDLKPEAITIAEDMSGMPGMCVPIEEGGIGFDYRLSMGVPDYWVRTLKNVPDERMDLFKMWYELKARRPFEKNIGYCESHDQALVGDKTIIFWLADKEMYDGMSVFSQNVLIDRAVALHKMIRFITLTLSGEGYLNFMGNEFGHPEWIDFPREGNGWSFAFAKRRWDLADRDDLRYAQLSAFDREMLDFAKEYRILEADDLLNLWIDAQDKVIAYRKAGLIFLFNFNPQRSIEHYELPVPEEDAETEKSGTGNPGKENPGADTYRVVFDSDTGRFGGRDRISQSTVYEVKELREKRGKRGIYIYTPSRTVLVLRKEDRK